MNNQVRYVHTVNPVTGQPCTIRVVVTKSDVTLWQVDQVFDSEEAWNLIDSEDTSIIEMPHDSFREVMGAYGEAFDRLMPDKPRVGRTRA